MTTELEAFEQTVKEIDADKPDPREGMFRQIPAMGAIYEERLKKMDGRRLNLARWLPSFSASVRPLIPGDFMVIMADTGQGKTAVLQNIAYHAAPPLPTAFFEIELSDDLMYERMLALHYKVDAEIVERNVRAQKAQDYRDKFNHLHFSTLSNIGLDDIRKGVHYLNSILPEPVAVVVLDYIGLIRAEGKSRYERFSNVAEGLKVLAKELDVVMVCASQVHRPEGTDETKPPALHSCKDSGSIENSAGLLLGVWRSGDMGEKLNLRILKNTRGTTGITIEARFNGETMAISDPFFAAYKDKS